MVQMFDKQVFEEQVFAGLAFDPSCVCSEGEGEAMASITAVPPDRPRGDDPYVRRGGRPRRDGVLGLDGLRLTARGRRVLVLLVTLLLAVPTISWGVGAVADSPDRAQEVRLQTVEPGDSLGQYARTSARPGDDLRDVVAALAELNGLETAELRAGQVLVLPLE